MKRLFVTLLLGVLFCQILFAQAEYSSIPPGKARVIALGGLIARAAPYQTSLRLGTAPFGSIVDVFDDNPSECQEGVLAEISMFLDYGGEEVADTFSRNGCWVKVKFGNQTAYMLDTYLLNVELEDSDTEVEFESEEDGDNEQIKPVFHFSDNYYLGFPGVNCVTNLPATDRLHWYGVFQNPMTEAAALESLKLSFFYHRSEMPMQVTFAEPSKGLKMIIGAKKQLSAFSPIGYFPMGSADFYVQEGEKYFQNEGLARKYGLRLELPSDPEQDIWQAKPLKLTRNGKTQILNPEKMRLDGPISLIWAGDLDADKHDDFVIQYGEKPGMILLYLSSEAKGKELVRAVAGYRVTYCC